MVVYFLECKKQKNMLSKKVDFGIGVNYSG